MTIFGYNFSKSLNAIGKTLMSLNTVRFKTKRPPFPPALPPGRKDCAKRQPPRCSKEAIAKLPKCEKKELPKTAKPECCDELCKDALPRFDELYDTESNKLTRKYQQTWCECPHIYIAPREVCCYDQHKYEPMEKRVFPKRPGGTIDPSIMLMLMCRNKSASKCAKVVWPGCRKVRDPPRCFEIKGPSDCKKVCTPFPAYSECQRDPPRPLRPVECNCLRLPAVCVSHLL